MIYAEPDPTEATPVPALPPPNALNFDQFLAQNQARGARDWGTSYQQPTQMLLPDRAFHDGMFNSNVWLTGVAG
jgi:hypothetical protein